MNYREYRDGYSQLYRSHHFVADPLGGNRISDEGEIFPNEPRIKEKWITATGRPKWFPTKTSTVCSAHFVDTDFAIKPSGKRYLNLESIPTIDVWLSSERPRDYNQQETRNMFVDEDDQTPLTPRERKLHIVIEIKERVIKKQRKQIKRIQTQNRRYQKKIDKLEYLLKAREQKVSLSDKDLDNTLILSIYIRRVRASRCVRQGDGRQGQSTPLPSRFLLLVITNAESNSQEKLYCRYLLNVVKRINDLYSKEHETLPLWIGYEFYYSTQVYSAGITLLDPFLLLRRVPILRHRDAFVRCTYTSAKTHTAYVKTMFPKCETLGIASCQLVVSSTCAQRWAQAPYAKTKRLLNLETSWFYPSPKRPAHYHFNDHFW
ncbi:hypothetical protein EVAR_57518_1 [Eumeta japonica]|uniref:THAP-type domain-containing protein n=1 Tax=Eumeta variegata TaxID=151549 RepID=A0A4C1ZQY8_EUMVA|nr:hypothetical protein EVAR_57518_1 [Eumeta japonica]